MVNPVQVQIDGRKCNLLIKFQFPYQFLQNVFRVKVRAGATILYSTYRTQGGTFGQRARNIFKFLARSKSSQTTSKSWYDRITFKIPFNSQQIIFDLIVLVYYVFERFWDIRLYFLDLQQYTRITCYARFKNSSFPYLRNVNFENLKSVGLTVSLTISEINSEYDRTFFLESIFGYFISSYINILRRLMVKKS